MQNALIMTGRQLYARLTDYVAPYRGTFALALLGMVVMAATEPALPVLLKLMLDGTLVNQKHELVQLVPLAVIVFFAVRGVASYLSIYVLNWVSGKLVTDLRVTMFDKLLMLPARYYTDHASDNLVATVTFDASRTVHTATGTISVLARDTLTIIALLAWMLYLDWKSALLALLLIPMIMLIMRLGNGQQQKSGQETEKTLDGMTRVLQESIKNYKVVKLYGGQQYQSQRFRNEVDRSHRSAMKQANAKAFIASLIQIAVGVVLAVAIYPATQQAATDGATAGGFVSLSMTMLLLILPVRRITAIHMSRHQGLAAARSTFSLLDQATEPDAGTVAIGRAQGELRFEQVGFHCHLQAGAALEGITLTLLPGETVALVDPVDSGKLILADLLPRFFQPDTGRILLDGQDLATLTLTSLRANIALVSWEMRLFNDTVAANIAYGTMGRATEADIIAAMHAAHAAEFVRELPQGLQTVVGEEGVQLSDGQRLRITIARALLKNSPILILDETSPSPAPDFKLGQQEQAALVTLIQGRTTIIIAQHPSAAAEKANRIILLQQGHITAIGSHLELLAKEEIYAGIFRT